MILVYGSLKISPMVFRGITDECSTSHVLMNSTYFYGFGIFVSGFSLSVNTLCS